MNIEKVKHIDRLIRIKAGNAKDIGDRLAITERAVYKYIKYMRTELNAPIVFDSTRKSYLYSEEGRLDFMWQPNKKTDYDKS
jgi:predicted transcriptional regulator